MKMFNKYKFVFKWRMKYVNLKSDYDEEKSSPNQIFAPSRNCKFR